MVNLDIYIGNTSIEIRTNEGWRNFNVGIAEKTSLLQALKSINECGSGENIAYHDYCCGFQFCNSCLMKVNGQMSHACLLILEAGKTYKVEPRKDNGILRDLIVEED